jgi:Bacterial low temperature requirement A protein (LtrA)
MKQTSSASLLRERKDGSEARVGSVELFFDLVFVFAVTQLSHFLLHHLTPLGAVQTCFALAPLSARHSYRALSMRSFEAPEKIWTVQLSRSNGFQGARRRRVGPSL